jgi:hypothetical protein
MQNPLHRHSAISVVAQYQLGKRIVGYGLLIPVWWMPQCICTVTLLFITVEALTSLLTVIATQLALYYYALLMSIDYLSFLSCARRCLREHC